jgi:hypothetical protein
LLIGEEHDAKLAHNAFEAAVTERERECISLLPPDAFRTSIGLRTVEHWLIEIRGGNADCFGQRAYQFACHDTGSGGDFEDIAGCHALEPSSQKTRVWFE